MTYATGLYDSNKKAGATHRLLLIA